MLLQTAQDLERCRTLFSSYTAAACTVAFPRPSLEGHYSLTTFALNAGTFTLQAAPQGVQVSDAECGTLMLSSNGDQGSLGVPNADANGLLVAT